MTTKKKAAKKKAAKKRPAKNVKVPADIRRAIRAAEKKALVKSTRYRGWTARTARRGGRWWSAAGRSVRGVKEAIPAGATYETRAKALEAVKKKIDRLDKKKKNPPPARSTKSIPSTALKRAPVNLDGDDLAELGSVLEVETDGATLVWARGRATLAWSPKAKALVIIEGAKRTKAPKVHWAGGGDPQVAAARRSFERFADRDANKAATLEVSPRGPWRSVGPVKRIDYHSDKWGRRREYTHKSGPGVRLYLKGSWSKTPRLWVMKGGRMTVTPRGIVN